MNKRKLYESIMKGISKIVKKHLDEAMLTIDLKETDEFERQCWEYIEKHNVTDLILKKVPRRDYEAIYLANKREQVYKTYESYEEDLSEYNAKHTLILDNVFETLKEKYGLHSEQLLRRSKYGIQNGEIYIEPYPEIVPTMPVDKAHIIIEDYENNKNAIIKEMNDVGYMCIREMPVTDKNGNKFWGMLFNPIEQFHLNNYMYDRMHEKGYEYLYHTTHPINDASIHKYGLVPSDGEDFKYEKRLYFGYEEEHMEDYIKMMIMLAVQKRQGFKYIKYSLRITPELLHTYTFYKDSNAYDSCYTNDTVDSKFITKSELGTYLKYLNTDNNSNI